MSKYFQNVLGILNFFYLNVFKKKLLDIEVTKTAEGSKVTVDADNKVLKAVGTKFSSWILKHMARKNKK